MYPQSIFWRMWQRGGDTVATQILNPTDCAREIVEVLEKHGITIYEMDKVLETAKGIAYSSTHIQSEKESE